MTEAQVINLIGYGPFHWHNHQKQSVFQNEVSDASGIYLWAIPYEDGNLVYYTGETGRSFYLRFVEHLNSYLACSYQMYHPEFFAQGIKQHIWKGSYSNKEYRVDELLDKHQELSKVVPKLLNTMNLFLFPIDTSSEIRQRIEARIARHLYAQEGVVGEFQDKGIRYRRPRTDDVLMTVELELPHKILGLEKQFEV